MSAFVEPLRLVLLAETPQWSELLRERLGAVGGPLPLSCAANWPDARQLLDAADDAVLLTTPAHLPDSRRCSAPIILLLEHEPADTPPQVCDWLVRDQLSADVLRRSLRYVREQGRLRLTLQRLAEQDALTGIANRQGFHTLLAARLDEPDRRGLALIQLDLDNFRQANDALGDCAGDQLIKQVVARLQQYLERGDQMARLGGDEFALLLHRHDDLERLHARVQHLLEALGEPYWVDGESLLLGCSLGVALAKPASTADALMWTPISPCSRRKAAKAAPTISTTNAWTTACAARSTCSASCAGRCARASCSCITSRGCACTAAPSLAWRRWCAGSTKRTGCCLSLIHI